MKQRLATRALVIAMFCACSSYANVNVTGETYTVDSYGDDYSGSDDEWECHSRKPTRQEIEGGGMGRYLPLNAKVW